MPKKKENLPTGWEIRKLEGLLEKIVGGGTPTRAKEAYFVGHIPWVTVKDMTVPYLVDAQEHINENAILESASNLIPENQVLLATRIGVGRVCINLKPVAINQDLKALFFVDKIHKAFMLYWFQRNQSFIESISAGSTVKGIDLIQLKKLEILLPPLPEQVRIASVLSSVDDLLCASRLMLEQWKKIRKNVMQKLLTRDKKANQWKLQTLNDICEKITDGTHQSVTTSSSGEVPFLNISAIENAAINWERAEFISREVYKIISRGREPQIGLILYSAVGSYGKAAIVEYEIDFTFQRNIAYILPDAKFVKPKFLYFWLNSDMALSQAHARAVGNAQKLITLKSLSQFTIDLPPLEEQERIVTILSSFDARIRTEEQYILQLENIKKGLMQFLLTGRFLLGAL